MVEEGQKSGREYIKWIATAEGKAGDDIVGVVAGACSPTGDLRVANTCEDYCNRAIDCNDNLDYEDCVRDCQDSVDDCDNDADAEEALDQLDSCVTVSCNDFAGCTVEAYVECVL